MKNLTKLILVSIVIGSTSSQATIIGARVTGGIFSGSQDGGIGSNYAYIEGDQTTAPVHNFRAEASFNVGALTPVLKAETYSDDLLTPYGGDIASTARAYGLQTYQNTSGTTQTYTLNLNLDGDTLSTTRFSSYIDAEVSIFSGTNLVSDFPECGFSAIFDYLSAFDVWSCGPNIATGFTPFIEISAGGYQAISDTVSFDIAAGGTFTIYAELKTITWGGHADAFSTMTMNFDDISNLAALGEMSAVPVPAAIWLFGSGLIGLIGVSRRKARA